MDQKAQYMNFETPLFANDVWSWKGGNGYIDIEQDIFCDGVFACAGDAGIRPIHLHVLEVL
jgi:hypothetical protein